jgi:long-subunit fatty acid transport protein
MLHSTKVYLVGLLCLIGFSNINAQGIEEAIRYSTHGLGGSTRGLGTANAIGAVGGSSTTALVNPAGLALNRKSELHFGLNINSNATQSTYNGSPAQGDINVGIGLSNINVSIYQLTRDYDNKPVNRGLTNVVYSFGYNRHSDYRSSFTYTGNNKESSFTDYLAEQANGTDIDDLNINGLGYLAYETYLIEPKTNKPDSYASVIRNINVTNVKQTGVVERTGSGGDFNFSMAADFENTFYIGGGILIRKQVFTETLQYIEKDNQPSTDTNDYRGLTYTRYLNTKSNGFGINLGGLLKANDNWRFGLSYTSPIMMRAKDLYTQSLTGEYDANRDSSIPDKSYTRTTPDDNFDGAQDTLGYKYQLKTPGRVTFSTAYVFGKLGFINVDVERVNIATASLSPKDDPTYLFTEENTTISQSYKPVYNVRIGGELTYGKYRFRAGYAFYPTPFKTSGVSQIKPLNRKYYTLGLGYYDPNYSLNAALVITSSTDNYQPYALELGRKVYAAEVKNNFVSVQFGATILVD